MLNAWNEELAWLVELTSNNGTLESRDAGSDGIFLSAIHKALLHYSCCCLQLNNMSEATFTMSESKEHRVKAQ